ncbi:MAG: hypothetical protein JXA21_21525 [Anaerolineae bacterium]|nr:hypothetical protein [Anaerolineae bacterium]
MVRMKTNTGARTRLALLSLLWAAILLFGAGVQVFAQETVKTSHAYNYGQTATFLLSLSPGSAAVESTLYLTIADTLTRNYTVPLVDNQAQHVRDLHEYPFPPFAEITYWWEFTDSQGKIQTTDKTTFLYDDNRFRWRTLEKDGVVVHWVSGESSLMVTALDAALAARDQIQSTLQTLTADTITLYIYPSTHDLQSALLLTGHEWIGGKAYPEIGVILLAISPTAEAPLKMNRDIPHEMTHKVLYDLVGSQGYDTLPIWLVEGLASHFELEPDANYALALDAADKAGTLIPLEQLCYPFSNDGDRVILAYAQSQSFVSYLQQTYGWSQLRALIEEYADGVSCSSGVVNVLADDLPTLDREWRVWLHQKGASPEPAGFWAAAMVSLRNMAPWLVLVVILGAPLWILFLETRRRSGHAA